MTNDNKVNKVYVQPAFNLDNIGWVMALPPAPNQHLMIFNYRQKKSFKRHTLAAALADRPGCKSINNAWKDDMIHTVPAPITTWNIKGTAR
jgi:hypothetical protein